MEFVQLLNILLLDISAGMNYNKILEKLPKPIRILLVAMLANTFIGALRPAINLNKFTYFVLIGRKDEKYQRPCLVLGIRNERDVKSKKQRIKEPENIYI